MIFNISEAANLAIHALAFLAENPDLQPVATRRVAEDLGVSENHLSKVFQRLTKVGLVKPSRGPSGGFSLARVPSEITLKDIYEAIDGPLGGGSCLLNHPSCDRKSCVFGDLVSSVHDRVDRHFSSTTLESLMEK